MVIRTCTFKLFNLAIEIKSWFAFTAECTYFGPIIILALMTTHLPQVKICRYAMFFGVCKCGCSGIFLFDLILYAPTTVFQLNVSLIFAPLLTLLKDHNAVMPVRPFVFKSSTLPLRSHPQVFNCISIN